MADPRFFQKAQARTLADIAAIAGGTLADAATASLVIDDVAALDKAGEGQISFLDNPKYKDSFITSAAAACIVAEPLVALAPKGMALIISKNPYKSYALVAQAFYPVVFPDAQISPAANVDPSAKISRGVVVDAGAFIGAHAEIGEGTWIGANTVVSAGIKIGARCKIDPSVTISHAIIGDAAHIYPGVRIGQDGFGFAIDPAGHVKVPQLGRVIIGDNVVIGANTCIDRGAGPDTVIGSGTWIDNLVQIAHNVQIGRGCVLVAQCGIAGSTVLEDYAVVAAQVGVAGHLRIGMGARIAAQSGVMRDIPARQEQMGTPAQPIKEHMRQIVALKRLTKPQKSE